MIRVEDPSTGEVIWINPSTIQSLNYKPVKDAGGRPGDRGNQLDTTENIMSGILKIVCPYCVGRIGRIITTCEDCLGSGIVTSMRTYTTIDKSAWGEGPWIDEPDKVQWIDGATELDCLAVRNASLGNWCGYVGIAEGHPLFGKGYAKCAIGRCDDSYCDHAPATMLSVHGGLSFADACQEAEDSWHGICHIPLPGRAAHIWWLGFDCGHAGDLCPGLMAQLRSIGLGDRPGHSGDEYRGLNYVRTECESLARQLAAIEAEASSPTALD